MAGFIMRRAAQALVVVWLVTLIIFVLLHMLPGGPARAILGKNATPLAVQQFDRAQGYDKPLPVQYGIWINQLLHGDLGYSYSMNESVTTAIGAALPKSVLLSGLATAGALILALPLGLIQAVRRRKPDDYLISTAVLVAYSTPTFFLGLMLILGFSVHLGWFPSEAPQSGSVITILRQFVGLVLPIVTLGAGIVANFSRYARSSILDVLAEDFVRTARAKGLRERTVLVRHVLRNALASTVTLVGLSVPVILAGSVVVEQLFNYPGMGLLFWQEAQYDDYPTILGVCLLAGAATILGNLLADLAYSLLDPRVRYKPT